MMKLLAEAGFLLLAASGALAYNRTGKISDALLFGGGLALALVQFPILLP